MNADLIAKFARNRTLLINNSITYDAIRLLKDKFYELFIGSDEDIYVIIDSDGGVLDQIWGLADQFRMITNKVIGVVIGNAFSSAFHILQSCDLRLATPNSHFIIHHVSFVLKNSMSLSKKEAFAIFQKMYNEFRVNQKMWERAIATRSGISISTIREFMVRGDRLDEVITVNEALKFNFIDSIVKSVPDFKKKTRGLKKFNW